MRERSASSVSSSLPIKPGDVSASEAQGSASSAFDLRLGDCDDRATGLVTLADLSVDVAIMDPPYGEHTQANVRTTKGKRTGGDAAIDLGFEPLRPWVRSYVADQLGRIVKRWVVVFSDHEGVADWSRDLERGGIDVHRIGVWVRKGAPQITGDRPAAGSEAIIIGHQTNYRGRMRWNDGGCDAVYDVPMMHAASKEHPSHKPPRLMDLLISDFTEPDELVLDPFCGSGSTLAAAVKAGRRAIGWERDAGHHATASARLSGCQGRRIEGQGELFAGGAA